MDIYTYTDYKQYLSDYFILKKDEVASFTFGVWARALGLKTTASLTLIVNGDRHPGKDIQNKFFDYFQFDKNAQSYFQDLVLLKKAEKKDQSLYISILKKIQKNKGKKYNTVSEEIFKQIGKWYYFTLREIISIKDFTQSPKELADKIIFPVSEKQIAQAFSDLEQLEVIEKKNGRFQNTTEGLNTIDEIPSSTIREFHKQMLTNAGQALDLVDVSERYFSALTLPMNSEQLDKLKVFIREFEDELLATFTKGKADQVYQMNFQLFPLTKMENETEKQ